MSKNATHERAALLRKQKERAIEKRGIFFTKRWQNAQEDIKKFKDRYSNEIHDLEDEAKKLEQKEAELIKQLEQTQEQERIAFESLKDAIVESSVGNKMRKPNQLKSIDKTQKDEANISDQ